MAEKLETSYTYQTAYGAIPVEPTYICQPAYGVAPVVPTVLPKYGPAPIVPEPTSPTYYPEPTVLPKYGPYPITSVTSPTYYPEPTVLPKYGPYPITSVTSPTYYPEPTVLPKYGPYPITSPTSPTYYPTMPTVLPKYGPYPVTEPTIYYPVPTRTKYDCYKKAESFLDKVYSVLDDFKTFEKNAGTLRGAFADALLGASDEHIDMTFGLARHTEDNFLLAMGMVCQIYDNESELSQYKKYLIDNSSSTDDLKLSSTAVTRASNSKMKIPSTGIIQQLTEANERLKKRVNSLGQMRINPVNYPMIVNSPYLIDNAKIADTTEIGKVNTKMQSTMKISEEALSELRAYDDFDTAYTEEVYIGAPPVKDAFVPALAAEYESKLKDANTAYENAYFQTEAYKDFYESMQ